MAFYFERFRKPKTIVSPTAASTTVAAGIGNVSFLSSTAYGTNFPISLYCLTGDIHISTLTTAPTTSLGYKLSTGMSLNLEVQDYLAMVSTSTAATYQAIIWER
jgi:hypothetical protein